MTPQRYPIGQQDFATIRKEGKVYVDKTDLIYNLIDRYNYVFLARPRRFGKSFLLSTIQAYMEGKKELFDGLAIANLEKDWISYPVLHLELSRIDSGSPASLTSLLNNQFKEWEKIYAIEETDFDLSQRFENIIKGAFRSTSQRVVILVDEYDNPLINTLHNRSIHDRNRELLKSIYSNFKALDGFIKFAMLSGVSRFSKTSIFSGVNNLTDISFYDRYASICGFTEEEIKKYLWPGVEILGREKKKSPEQALADLKASYDGYHFTENCVDIYNPYSLLRALDESKIKSYWFETATPGFLVEKLKESSIPFASLFNDIADSATLSEPDTYSSSPVALLYQTGYLTIKGYEKRYEEYRLGIPNMEVKKGLFEALLTFLLEQDKREARTRVSKMRESLEKGEPHVFLDHLRSFLAKVPNSIMPKMPEAYFEHALYILLQLIDVESEVEVSTSYGRIDLLITTEKYRYVIEIKLDKDSGTALSQIERKEYVLPYKFDERKVFNIGVNFSSKTRNITDWTISTP